MATVGYMVRSAKAPTFRRLGMTFSADKDTFVPYDKLTETQREFLLSSDPKRELIVMPTDGTPAAKGTQSVEGSDTAEPDAPHVEAAHESADAEKGRRKR